MLREAKNAAWAPSSRWWRRRIVFTAGRLVAARGLRPAEHAALEIEQRDTAVAVLLAPGGRTYWWCMDRFFWEDDGLSADDVYALAYERDHRAATARPRPSDRRARPGAARAPPRVDLPRRPPRRLGARRRRLRAVRRRLRAAVRPHHPRRPRRRDDTREPPGPLRSVQPHQGREGRLGPAPQRRPRRGVPRHPVHRPARNAAALPRNRPFNGVR